MNFELLTTLTCNEQKESGREGWFDLSEHAARLDNGYGHYFKEEPQDRLYYDRVMDPVIDLSRAEYHTELLAGSRVTRTIPLVSIEAILGCAGDIWDKNKMLRVPAKLVKTLRRKTSFPVRMFEFLTTYVALTALDRVPAYKRESRRDNFHELLKSSLRDEFLKSVEMVVPEVAIEFYNEVFYCLEPLMSDVREFLGPNKWMLFNATRINTDLKIESMVDYRIYKYHEGLLGEQ